MSCPPPGNHRGAPTLAGLAAPPLLPSDSLGDHDDDFAAAQAAAGDDPSLNISGAFLVPPVFGPCKIADCEFQRDETACDELLAIVEERYCRAA